MGDAITMQIVPSRSIGTEIAKIPSTNQKVSLKTRPVVIGRLKLDRYTLVAPIKNGTPIKNCILNKLLLSSAIL